MVRSNRHATVAQTAENVHAGSDRKMSEHRSLLPKAPTVGHVSLRITTRVHASGHDIEQAVVMLCLIDVDQCFHRKLSI